MSHTAAPPRQCRRCKRPDQAGPHRSAADQPWLCADCAETLRLRKVLLGLALGFGAILALVAKELRLW